MKIALRDIKPGGLDVKGEIGRDFIGVRDEDGLKFVESLQLLVNVKRVENEVLANIKVNGKYLSVCSRCLTEVEQLWSEKFLITSAIDKKMEYIDFSDELRQEIILNLPTKILCCKDCKGICANCGVNLNKKKCKCK